MEYDIDIGEIEEYSTAGDCNDSYTADDISVSTISKAIFAGAGAAILVPIGAETAAALGYVKGKMFDEGTEGHIDNQALQFSYVGGAIAGTVGAAGGVLVEEGIEYLGVAAKEKWDDWWHKDKEE